MFWCFVRFSVPHAAATQWEEQHFPPHWQRSDCLFWPPQPGWRLPRKVSRHSFTWSKALASLTSVYSLWSTPDNCRPANQRPLWLPPAVRCPFLIPPSLSFMFQGGVFFCKDYRVFWVCVSLSLFPQKVHAASFQQNVPCLINCMHVWCGCVRYPAVKHEWWEGWSTLTENSGILL